MDIGKKICIRDCRCNECNKKLEVDKDYRVAVTFNKKDIVLCEMCYKELVIKICITNID